MAARSCIYSVRAGRDENRRRSFLRTLDQVIAEVLAYNPKLQAAKARIEQAQAKLDQVNAAFFPKITAQVTKKLRI
ncbi:MAG: TolC family protein [Methylohalobius sp.]